MNLAPFSPQATGTIVISATQTAASTAFTTNAASSYMITNGGANTVFHTVTKAAATASVTTSTPVLAGAIMIFSMPEDAAFVNTICASGQSATVYVTPGEGQ